MRRHANKLIFSFVEHVQLAITGPELASGVADFFFKRKVKPRNFFKAQSVLHGNGEFIAVAEGIRQALRLLSKS